MWHLKKVNKGRIFPQPSFFCAQMWVVGRYFYIILNKPLGLFWYWVTSHVCDFWLSQESVCESLFCCRKRTITLLPNQLLPDPPRKKKSYLKQISLYLVSEIHSGQEFKCVFSYWTTCRPSSLSGRVPIPGVGWPSSPAEDASIILGTFLDFVLYIFFSVSIVIKTFQ